MATSPSSSDYSDTEDSFPESKSNLSLSVGYFPCDDIFSYEDTTFCEDTTSLASSVHFLPPIQGTWGTESTRRLARRQNQIQDDPRQFCKLSINLAWDVDVGSDHEDSIANWDLSGDNQWMDRWPQEGTKLTLSTLDSLVQKLETFLESEKDDENNDYVVPGSTQKEDVQLSSSSLPHMPQVITQAPGSHRRSVIEAASISSRGPEQEEEEPSNTDPASCLNFGGAFRWLRKRVFSWWRREHPNQVTINWHQKTLKREHSLMSNRIHPQE